MEEFMATTLELPTKRAVEEVGSGSGSEASKKEKVGGGDDYWEIASLEEFDDRYGDLFAGRLSYKWKSYLVELEDKWKVREIQLVLRSEGRVKEADELQSLDDKLASNVLSRRDFQHKGWLLRPIPGRYTDYQRLYVADSYHYENGVLMNEYGHLYCTYASDLAFQKFFKELQSLITWDLSWSDIERIGEDASKKYKDLEPAIVGYAINEAYRLKKDEQERKEMVPFYTMLWLEVVRNKRDPMDLLDEIIDSDAASFRASINSIKKQIRRDSARACLPCLGILDSLTKYIDTASKGVHYNENDIKELIQERFDTVRRHPALLYGYAHYLEKKLPVAVNSGLTTC